ncbi:hypothetical protein M0R45_026195 [Rubus argutus]|uniref:Homeobox domain-containing protein n=1 Tax=Rubus argutus TaxID=59490 RepID=A0AAW1X0E9_RUBAR
MLSHLLNLNLKRSNNKSPIQAVEQPVFPEAGPSQRKPAKNKRYSHVQIRALEDFIAAHPTPTYDQKFLLSQQIGLPMKKVNKWITKHKAPVIQSDEQLIAELISRNEELVKEIEELKAQNQILINCSPSRQLSPMRRSCSAPRTPLEGCTGIHAIWKSTGTCSRPCWSPLRRSIWHRPKSQGRIYFHGYCGISSVDLSSTDSNAYHPETLNYLEYLRMSQRGGVAPYFQSEASRHSATIRVNPITIVQTLMDVNQWLHIFCSMVTNAQILEILSPGEEESYKERTQVMSAEFVLPTPKVPAREAQVRSVFSPTTGRKLDHCRCLRG